MDYSFSFVLMAEFTIHHITDLKLRIKKSMYKLFKGKKISIRLDNRRRYLYDVLKAFNGLEIFKISLNESHLVEKNPKITSKIDIVRIGLKGSDLVTHYFPRNLEFISSMRYLVIF